MGGAVQVCAELITQFTWNLAAADVEWYFCLSPVIAEALESRGVRVSDLNHCIVSSSPAKDRSARRQLARLVRQASSDAVFTVFGPAYVRFDRPHLLGVADGWVTHSTRLAYSSLPTVAAQLKMLGTCCYKGLWYRQADRWIVEAPVARHGLSKRWRVPLEAIEVVPNNCASNYLDAAATKCHSTDDVRFLTLSAAYPHKNLELIPHIAAALRAQRPNRRFEFRLTLPHDNPAWQRVAALAEKLGVADSVVNLGVVKVGDGPAAYQQCDICFLPTLLETFTAVYPEAMAMQRPIVTTDLAFAHDICGDAAAFFTPKDAQSAATAILRLVDDPNYASQLVERGLQRLTSFLSPRDRAQRAIEILTDMVSPQGAT